MGCYSCMIYTRILIYIGTIILHATNMIVMNNSFQGDAMKSENLMNLYQIKAYFFTLWTTVFQMCYASFAIFCDWRILKHLKDTSEKRPALSGSLMNFRDTIYTIIVWPSTLEVFTYFWGFYAYDRSLFYPGYYDAVITPTSNHIMHTLILPIALLEIVLSPKRKPESNLIPLLCMYGLQVVYLSTLFYAHKTTGIWVYPIFEKMTGSACLPMFILTTLVLMTVYYYAQFWISSLVFNIREKIGRKYCKSYANCN